MKAVPTGPEYPQSPLIRTHKPPKVRGLLGYQRYRQCLRLEFGFRCVYCLSHETEFGQGQPYGGFEVEHFRPKGLRQFGSLRNSYGNLMWACRACNRAKSNTWPTRAEFELGYRFLNPDKDAFGNHLRVQGETVIADDNAGVYTIQEVNLTSQQHRARRRKRQQDATNLALLEGSLTVLRERAQTDVPDLHVRSEVLGEIDRIERRMREIGACIDGTPWDAPAACLC